MTAQNKTTIKTYFETGDIPTQAQFVDLIDSYVDTIDGVITSAAITNSIVSGSVINNFTASAGTINATTLNTVVINGATVSAPIISNPTVTSGAFTRVTIASATVTNPFIVSASVSASTINNSLLTTTSAQVINGGPITGNNIHNSSFPQGGAAQQDIRSDTYVPVSTGNTNVTTVTLATARSTRVGNNVTVAGFGSVTPTSAATAIVNLSVLTSANFANNSDLSGVGTAAPSGGAIVVGTIQANSTNDCAQLIFIAPNNSQRDFSYIYKYTVI